MDDDQKVEVILEAAIQIYGLSAAVRVFRKLVRDHIPNTDWDALLGGLVYRHLCEAEDEANSTPY